MKNFVAKIVLRGRDINSTDMKDFVFHSNNPSAKINMKADPLHTRILAYTHGAEPGAGRTNLLKFEHGYAYTPGICAFFSFNNVNFYMTPYSELETDFDTGASKRRSYHAYTDEKYFYFDILQEGTLPQTLINGTTVYLKYNILDVVGMI